MNIKEVAADLRYCRRESGLSGADVSHLLSITTSRLSRIENGHSEPRLVELCGLSLIYGKQLLEIFPAMSLALVIKVKEKLSDLPKEPANWRARQQRLQSINELAHRLFALSQEPYDTIKF